MHNNEREGARYKLSPGDKRCQKYFHRNKKDPTECVRTKEGSKGSSYTLSPGAKRCRKDFHRNKNDPTECIRINDVQPKKKNKKRKVSKSSASDSSDGSSYTLSPGARKCRKDFRRNRKDPTECIKTKHSQPQKKIIQAKSPPPPTVHHRAKPKSPPPSTTRHRAKPTSPPPTTPFYPSKSTAAPPPSPPPTAYPTKGTKHVQKSPGATTPRMMPSSPPTFPATAAPKNKHKRSSPSSSSANASSSSTATFESVLDGNGAHVIFKELPPRPPGTPSMNPNIREGDKKNIQRYDATEKIFFSPAYSLVGIPTPMMLVRQQTWFKMLQDGNIHRGAFGSDYVDIKHHGEDWTLVWKFPTDLKYLPMYSRTHTWLPVGTYSMDDDYGDMARQTRLTDFKPQLISQRMTKYRYEMANGVDVHFLENSSNYKIPMISSMYFFHDMWATPTESEVTKVHELIENLEALGVIAFSCHKQHHAVVLYGYLESNAQDGAGNTHTTLTTRLFAGLINKGLLDKNMPWLNAIHDALRAACHSAAKSADINRWFENASTMYSKHSSPSAEDIRKANYRPAPGASSRFAM